ncbi:MAG: ribosomal-protein-alanine N-acetyltransferase [Gammaproteobacteria bacterium]|nr:ribosomal-protein-alanine N-acetyltransferase [Gammaproteobacteria bacterium]
MNIEFIIPDSTHLPALYDIECQAHPYPWSYQLLASNFGERYCNGALRCQQQLIGFYIADVLLDESTLMNICIDPAWQGQGLGQQLLTHYLQQTAARGCTQWWLEVRASNLTAQNLYRKAGFREVGVRKNYYRSGEVSEDALVMQRIQEG